MSRIALLVPDLEVGGAQHIMLMLAREFIEQGHDVDILVISAKGTLHDRIPEGALLTEFCRPSRRLGEAGLAVCAIWRLSAWLRRYRPQAILSTVTGTNLVAVVARKLAGIPARLVIREASALRNVKSYLRIWLMRRLYPQADAIVTLTSVMQGELRKYIGVSEDKVFCIPNFVDGNFIKKMAKMPVDHPKFQRTPGDKIIVSVGRLVSVKDYQTLIQAMAQVVKVYRARLFIIGDGPERRRLTSLTNKLSLEDNVVFIGFDHNPWRWLARADLFVLPSLWEGHPNSLLEALALNRPSIVTDYDGSVHEMARIHNFTVVPRGNPRGMARAIIEQFDAVLMARSGVKNIADVKTIAGVYLALLVGRV